MLLEIEKCSSWWWNEGMKERNGKGEESGDHKKWEKLLEWKKWLCYGNNKIIMASFYDIYNIHFLPLSDFSFSLFFFLISPPFLSHSSTLLFAFISCLKICLFNQNVAWCFLHLNRGEELEKVWKKGSETNMYTRRYTLRRQSKGVR